MRWDWWNVPQKTVFTPPPKHKPEAPGWISTRDDLPEPHKIVLTWGAEGYSLARCVRQGPGPQDYVWVGVSFLFEGEGCPITNVQVSHWQHLPKPPKREGIDDGKR
jgi:hypothetical protein